MNIEDESQMPIAEITNWSADEWAEEWKKEAQARCNDFVAYKTKTKILEQEIDDMRNAITSSIELLQGLDVHLKQNHGMFLLMAIENLKPYVK